MGADEDYDELAAAAHRAIGRWIVEFSLLLAYMRTVIGERLNPDPPILAEFVLGEATANQIASMFFGMCRYLANHALDQDELKIAVRLQRRVVAEEIERRNDIAHGDWFIDTRQSPDAPYGSVQVIRIRPARKEGAVKTIDMTVQQLDEWSQSLAALRDIVAEYGSICFGVSQYAENNIRVRDIFVLKANEVVREGPRAPCMEKYL